jgi:hypothetical protein
MDRSTPPNLEREHGWLRAPLTCTLCVSVVRPRLIVGSLLFISVFSTVVATLFQCLLAGMCNSRSTHSKTVLLIETFHGSIYFYVLGI